MSDTRGPSSWITNLLLIVMVAAVAYVMYGLVRENRALKARVAELESSPVGETLVAGADLPATPLASATGEEAVLDEMLATGGVVVFLTTTCPYCEATLPRWTDLAARFAERDVPFVGVSLDPRPATDEYARAHRLAWPLWVPADGFGAIPEVVRVPLTVLVGADGTVLESWLGVLTPAQAEQILAALDDLATNSLLSGSSAEDPGCCADPVPGTGTGS